MTADESKAETQGESKATKSSAGNPDDKKIESGNIENTTTNDVKDEAT